LQVQGRVCTGPEQSRPLGLSDSDPLQPDRALSVLLRSGRGELPPAEQVSLAQMGAFFAAMRIRRRFDSNGAWNEAERRAFAAAQEQLENTLPPVALALLDPEATFHPSSAADQALWPAVKRVLDGEHLSTAHTSEALTHVLSTQVSPALAAALLIGQRMNIEDHDEALAYLRAAAPIPMDVELASLTHVGQPYNGSARSFRPALFAAALSAELGMPTLLHGVEAMPPKDGITELQTLRAMQPAARFTQEEAHRALTDPAVGFAFVDQHEFAPERQALITLRRHIKKRPVFATTEKVTLLFRATGRNHMLCGYFHPGYDDKILALMRTHALDTEIVFRGREGSTDPALRSRQRDDAKAMNQCRIRRRVDDAWHETSLRVDPAALGIEPSPAAQPRSAEMAAEIGCQALRGAATSDRESIALSAAVRHHVATQSATLSESLGAAHAAIDSGGAWARLQRYLNTGRSS